MAKKATHYEDLPKTTTDFLTKGYPKDSTFKVGAESKAGGFFWKVFASRSINKEGHEVNTASIEPKYTFKEHNVDVELKFTNDNSINLKGSATDILSPGTKLSVSGEQKLEEKVPVTNGIVGFEYQHEKAAIKLAGTLPLEKDSKRGKVILNGSAVFVPIEALSIGVKGNFNYAAVQKDKTEKNTWDAAATAQYEHDAWKASGSYGVEKKAVSFFGSYDILPTRKIAVGINGDLNMHTPPTIVIGGEEKLEDCTVKVKLDVRAHSFVQPKDKAAEIEKPKTDDTFPEIRVAFGINQKLNQNVSVTFGVDFNMSTTMNKDNKGAMHSAGLEFLFK